jgi:hypothetical protein
MSSPVHAWLERHCESGSNCLRLDMIQRGHSEEATTPRHTDESKEALTAFCWCHFVRPHHPHVSHVCQWNITPTSTSHTAPRENLVAAEPISLINVSQSIFPFEFVGTEDTDSSVVLRTRRPGQWPLWPGIAVPRRDRQGYESRQACSPQLFNYQ